MRRCPECSFIYEDDQSLCDMDGTALVPDARLFADQGSDKTGPTSSQNARTRRIAVSAVAAIVLMAVLFAVYFFITRPEPPQNSRPAGPSINQSSTTATTAQESKPVDANEPAKDEPSSSTSTSNDSATETDRQAPSKPGSSDRRLTISSEIPPLRRVPPLRRLPPARVAEKSNSQRAVATNQKPAANKKDSKVNSLLKKTGRVLTKPFRF